MKSKNIPPFPAELRTEADAPEMEAVWESMAPNAPAITPEETEAAWLQLKARLALPGASTGPAVVESLPGPGAARTGTATPIRGATHRSSSPLRAGLRFALRAAVVVFVVLGGTAVWYSTPVTRTADAGERLEVVLPDGSMVALNAGSSISYRRGFDILPGFEAPSRTVELRGEAFFDVESAVRAFRVEAGDTEVRVLGTRFNVRARSGGDLRVDVEEGRVQVSQVETERSLILRAGNAAAMDVETGDLVASTVDPNRVGAWRSGGMVMVDTPLSQIIAELSVRFDAQVRLADPATGSARLSVYYASVDGLESVVADLATQQGLRYRPIGDGWEIF